MAVLLESGWQAWRSGRIRFDPNPAAHAAQEALLQRILVIGTVAAAVLIGIAVANTMIIALYAARDTARSHAIMRALGATPRQTASAFVLAQLGAALIACAVGLPLGMVLFDHFAPELAAVGPPPIAYVLITLAIPLVYAGIVAIPARSLAARPVTPLLTYE